MKIQKHKIKSQLKKLVIIYGKSNLITETTLKQLINPELKFITIANAVKKKWGDSTLYTAMAWTFGNQNTICINEKVDYPPNVFASIAVHEINHWLNRNIRLKLNQAEREFLAVYAEQMYLLNRTILTRNQTTQIKNHVMNYFGSGKFFDKWNGSKFEGIDMVKVFSVGRVY